MSTFDLVGYFTFAGFVAGFIFGIVFVKKDDDETGN
jgi:hypothetical protein